MKVQQVFFFVINYNHTVYNPEEQPTGYYGYVFFVKFSQLKNFTER